MNLPIIMINCLLAYLLGSIPSGVWVGQYFYQTDIRQMGSGNMGTTNTFRVLGPKAGTIVLFMDLAKGAIPVLIATYLLPTFPFSSLFVGAFAVLGHTFPIFAQFRGGKAVATFSGVMLAYIPLVVLVCLVIFLVTLYLTRMVSLTSMVTISIGVLLTLFYQDWFLTTISLVADLFIIYRHRSNIKRILDGTESKVTFPWEKKQDTK